MKHFTWSDFEISEYSSIKDTTELTLICPCGDEIWLSGAMTLDNIKGIAVSHCDQKHAVLSIDGDSACETWVA